MISFRRPMHLTLPALAQRQSNLQFHSNIKRVTTLDGFTQARELSTSETVVATSAGGMAFSRWAAESISMVRGPVSTATKLIWSCASESIRPWTSRVNFDGQGPRVYSYEADMVMC